MKLIPYKCLSNICEQVVREFGPVVTDMPGECFISDNPDVARSCNIDIVGSALDTLCLPKPLIYVDPCTYEYEKHYIAYYLAIAGLQNKYHIDITLTLLIPPAFNGVNIHGLLQEGIKQVLGLTAVQYARARRWRVVGLLEPVLRFKLRELLTNERHIDTVHTILSKQFNVRFEKLDLTPIKTLAVYKLLEGFSNIRCDEEITALLDKLDEKDSPDIVAEIIIVASKKLIESLDFTVDAKYYKIPLSERRLKIDIHFVIAAKNLLKSPTSPAFT